MADAEKDKAGKKPDKPKIVVDDDWKAQAQAEKEKLAEQLEGGERAAGDEAAGGAAPAGEPRDIPPASFSTLVTMLATQALLAMQPVADPKTGKPTRNMDLAKHQVDALAVLEEKTKGNLTDDEKSLLDQALYQVRMQYVQIAQAGA